MANRFLARWASVLEKNKAGHAKKLPTQTYSLDRGKGTQAEPQADYDSLENCNFAWVFGLSGVTPKTETLVKAHLAERTASGKETSGAVSEGVPAGGGRAIEELRQRRGAGSRAGCASSAAIQMARSTGTDRGDRGVTPS